MYEFNWVILLLFFNFLLGLAIFRSYRSGYKTGQTHLRQQQYDLLLKKLRLVEDKRREQMDLMCFFREQPRDVYKYRELAAEKDTLSGLMFEFYQKFPPDDLYTIPREANGLKLYHMIQVENQGKWSEAKIVRFTETGLKAVKYGANGKAALFVRHKWDEENTRWKRA